MPCPRGGQTTLRTTQWSTPRRRRAVTQLMVRLSVSRRVADRALTSDHLPACLSFRLFSCTPCRFRVPDFIAEHPEFGDSAGAVFRRGCGGVGAIRAAADVEGVHGDGDQAVATRGTAGAADDT